nr:adenylate/guanylate cyclase domain-containing protein [Gammaproteobacteria bacterium]
MDIVTWLTELGLEKYAPEFTENEIDLDVVADLGEDDLRELGLPMGPRKKFLRAAKALNTPAERRVAPPTQNFDSSEAERRELTVMFVDLVGSTELSQRLDPEDLRAVVRAYQALCSRSIERYEGFVARYFGDGIMVYFGYPQAHENEPERAVRTALSILETLPELNRKLLEDGLVEVEIRIGIATGLV